MPRQQRRRGLGKSVVACLPEVVLTRKEANGHDIRCCHQNLPGSHSKLTRGRTSLPFTSSLKPSSRMERWVLNRSVMKLTQAPGDNSGGNSDGGGGGGGSTSIHGRVPSASAAPASGGKTFPRVDFLSLVGWRLRFSCFLGDRGASVLTCLVSRCFFRVCVAGSFSLSLSFSLLLPGLDSGSASSVPSPDTHGEEEEEEEIYTYDDDDPATGPIRSGGEPQVRGVWPAVQPFESTREHAVVYLSRHPNAS